MACVIWTLDKGQALPTVLQGAVKHRAVQWERDGHLVRGIKYETRSHKKFFGALSNMSLYMAEATFIAQYNNVSSAALHYFWPHPPVMKMQ